MQLFSNAGRGELAATINSTDTVITITANGAAYPVANTGTDAINTSADWFKCVLQDSTGIEIVYVRTHTASSLTFSNVLRGQEGTVARGFAANVTVFGMRITASDHAGYETVVKKDTSGGYAGLTLFKLNLRNAANTVTSWFTTAATVARTWTMPDKDGTVAMTSDITGINSGTNTGDQTNISGNAATATKMVTTNWTIEEVGGALYFKYGGVNRAKLTSTGAFVALDNVSAYTAVT
jgi:hypothetical protein